MIHIKPESFSELLNYKALLLTDSGVIVKHHTDPFHDFGDIISQFGDFITKVYLDKDILIAKVMPNITEESMLKFINGKIFLGNVETETEARLLRAFHWLNWDSKTQHCCKCGEKLEHLPNEVSKKCHPCNWLAFPNLAPAIIVLIHRGREVLLARSYHFKPGVYSALAGFIDLGETAEQAAHREVMEEVGLKIQKLEYFGSQSWPFPGSFMIGFKAEYHSGDINIDSNEIEDAKWYQLNRLPDLPSKASIARKMIESLI